MKTQIKVRPSVFTTVLSVAVLTLAIGCASSGYKKGEAVSSSIHKAAAKIAEVNSTANQVVTNLVDLTTNPQADLRPQFKAFSDSVDSLASQAADVRKAATSMEAKSQAFFTKWDEQVALIKNEDIKARGAARKKEVEDRFAAIHAGFVKAKDAFTPLMSDLTDLRTYLETDLTADGVAAMKKLAGKAVAGVPALSKSLSELQKEFEALGVAMAPAVEAQKAAK